MRLADGEAVEYVDTGVHGAKDRRPALDRLMQDARQRRVDVVVCWRLDRFGRNLRALIIAIEELNAAGVSFVSMGENIDTASPTWRLLLGIMGSFAQFERERIRKRLVVTFLIALTLASPVSGHPQLRVCVARVVGGGGG